MFSAAARGLRTLQFGGCLRLVSVDLLALIALVLLSLRLELHLRIADQHGPHETSHAMIGLPLREPGVIVPQRPIEPREQHAVAVALAAVLALTATYAGVVILVAGIVRVDALAGIRLSIHLRLMSLALGVRLSASAAAMRLLEHEADFVAIAFACAHRWRLVVLGCAH